MLGQRALAFCVAIAISEVQGSSRSAQVPTVPQGGNIQNLQHLSRAVATRAQDVGQFSLLLPSMVASSSPTQGSTNQNIQVGKHSHCLGNLCLRREPRTTPAPKVSQPSAPYSASEPTLPGLKAANVQNYPMYPTPPPALPAQPTTDTSSMDKSLATVTALSFVSSAIVTFAPVTSIIRVINGEAQSEEVAGLAAPYFFLWAQGYFWALYGLVVGNEDIAAINILGVFVAGAYLVALAGHEDPEEENEKADAEGFFGKMGTVKNLLGMATLACGIISVVALIVEDRSLRSELLAYVALCFNMGMVLAPLRQCADALRKQSMVGFPVALTIANFMSCGLWAQYSALTHNMAYLVPNMLGLLCNGIQMGVVAWAYILHGKSEAEPARSRPSAGDLLRAVAAYTSQSSEVEEQDAIPPASSRRGCSEPQSSIFGGTGGAQ